MNKSELIERLAQKIELGSVQAEEIVRLIIEQMRNALIGGKRIEITLRKQESILPAILR